MNIKIYKDYPSRTLGVFLIGLLVFAAGAIFAFAVYAQDGLEDYSQYFSAVLICLPGIIIMYRALFRRTVLVADSEGMTLSYLRSGHNVKVSWADIETIKLVTYANISKMSTNSYPNFLFTFLAVFLKPGTAQKLPRQRFWRMRKHPAIKILGQEADAYIPTYRINSYGPEFKLQETTFSQRDINKITVENNANKILEELEALRVKYTEGVTRG